MPEQIVLDAPVEERPDAAGLGAAAADQPQDELILEELLVEDVSIDGMCGVY
jgi:mycofactocin precursor